MTSLSAHQKSLLTAGRLRDQLGNGDVTRVSTAAFAVVDALQERKEELLPGEYIGAVAAAFILSLEAAHIPAADVFSLTRNLMADANGRRTEFTAIKEYIKGEILK